MPVRTALAACLIAASLTPSPIQAHPHVWVVVRSEIVVDGNGRIQAVRHAWTFDEIFSAYAAPGLDADEDGTLTRDELAPLAEMNVSSLMESDYFTFTAVDGMAVSFDTATDYWLEYSAPQLTLHFTLPLKEAVPRGSYFTVDVHDANYFVDFALAGSGMVAAEPDPYACEVHFDQSGPQQSTAAPEKISERTVMSLPSAAHVGGRYSKRIAVRCE